MATPLCPYFKLCNGCTCQHIDYSRQLDNKKTELKHAIGYPEIEVFTDKEYFYRNKNYYAPHNLFANLNEVKELVKSKMKSKKKYDKSFFQFNDLEDMENLDKASEIEINFSYPSFNVVFNYDESDQKYYRFLAGKKHLDSIDGSQIAPSNVVVLLTNYRTYDSYGRLEYDLIGEGSAMLFRNGRMVPANWKKSGVLERLNIFDKNAGEISFESGQIWIGFINDETKLDFF